MAEGEVRYCTTSDGVRIAYSVEGSGPPLVICCEFFNSFSFDHEYPELSAFYARIGEGHTVVRFDPRGVGLSDRDPTDVSAAALASDIDAVVQAAALRRFTIFAESIRGLVASQYAVLYPDELASLVLWGTYARTGVAYPEAIILAFAGLAEGDWNLASQTFADMTIRELYPAAALRDHDVNRKSTSGAHVGAVFRTNMDLDLRPRLPEIRARTLVMHRREDTAFPVAAAQELASGIPHARLIMFDGAAHSPYLGDIEPVVRAVRDFLAEDAERASDQRTGGETPAGAFRTILFTDLVGHTEMMRRLGDDRGRDVLREHERITRELLKEHGGAEVKTMGDGFMASFASVTKAMDCAIALQRAFAAHTDSTPEPLHVRVGLNAGEPIEEDGDLFGSTVIMASRIAAKAGAGEILIPEPLRHLLTGKSYVYADRGETMLKGFEDGVRLYEVRWRE